MKLRHRLRNVLAWILSFLLLGGLGLLLLLKVPIEDPVSPPSSFAPRDTRKNLPEINFQVFETGYSEAPEAYMEQGGSLWRNRRMTHSAVVISHPKGRVVLDSGLGSQFHEEVEQSPWVHRIFARFFIPTQALSRQAGFPNLDPKRDFFLLSHAHWDHVGGTRDFPEIPVKLLAEERSFATNLALSESHGVLPRQIQDLEARFAGLELTDRPYENFSRSLDLFGDGSIVLVSLAGHTPGSLGVFANLNNGMRYLFVGDALWSVDSEGRPQARSRLAEWTSDLEKMEARKTRLRLRELIRHSNEVTLVPIHDSKALQKLRPIDETSGS